MKKLTLLFALLCASVMGFAIDWTGVDWLANSNETYKVVVSPTGPNIVQEQDWAGKRCIYITYADANLGACSLDASLHATQGAGKFYYTSAFLQQETEFTQVHNGTTYTFTVYNAHPVTVPSTKASTPTVPASRVKGVYSMYDFNTGYTFANWCGNVKESSALVQGRTIPFYQMGNSCFGLEYGHFDVSNMTKIHLDIWTENDFSIRFYLISPGHETYYTIELNGGTWNSKDIPLSTFTDAGVVLNDVFQFKFDYPSVANQTIFVDNIYFYAESDVDPEPTDIEDTNFALRSKGAIASGTSVTGANYPIRAIDGDNGTIWESIYDTDPQILTVDLGQRRNFNLVKILWGNQWSSEFYIETSNNATDWTEAAHVTGNTAKNDHTEQSFELNGKKTARYVRFRGIQRANGWGYTIKTFEVLLAGVPELTSVELSADKKITKVGDYATLTTVTKDQNNSPIAATLSYTVSPADAGHVTDGKYYPDKFGTATITVTATAGTVELQQTTIVYGVTTDNIAETKDSKAGYQGGNNTEWADAANDGAESTAWVTWQNQPTASEWWYVDLGKVYDLMAIATSWGADYSTNYILQIRTDAPETTEEGDDEAWGDPIATVTTATANGTVFSTVSGTGQYVRIHSLSRSSGDCIRLRELQVFGTEAATLTKSVSASANNPTMGIATVKQNNVDVTEVTTGSTVTFSAVANDGYIFVDWSNGETAASFDAEVNTSMNLTANFRALNHISCNEEVTNGDYTAYVTYKKTANENEYTLIVRSAKTMVNFTNAYVGHINGNDQINMNGQGTLSGNGHKLTYTFTSTTEPKLNTPLYVNFANHGEVTFNQINNGTVFEFALPCADPEITAIALDKTEATLDLGNTLTLVPSFTPAYMSANITWETSDNTKATVENGVVTPVAPGSVTITAKVSESVKATCAITVQAAASHNWYGYGTSQDLDYTYRIEYTTDHHIVAHVKRQGSKTGLVDASMNINNVWTVISVAEGEEVGWKKGTTAEMYTAGDELHILIQSAYAGPTSIIEFDYTVGADNTMPTIVPSVLKLNTNAISMGVADEDVQLTAELHHRDAANPTILWTSDDETVATVVNGLVHPVGVGSATITAKSQADENVYATCEVTVVGVVEPATFWGNGTNDGVAIAYSITRNANHTLTYTVEALQDKVGFVVQVNDGDYHTATLDEGLYTWTSEATYIDGATINNGFFYMPHSLGAARVDFAYTVGSENARKYIPITVTENEDNTALLASNDGKVREVTVARSFTAGSLYTLVLPFDADASVLPGQLTKLNNTIVKDNGDLKVNFVDVDAIEAGVPYLYVPSADVANPVFNNVTINKNLNPTEPADGYAKYYGIYAPTTGVALKDIANAYVLGNDKYLYAASGLNDEQQMKALRGYFVLNFPSAAPGAPKRMAQVIFNGNETQTPTGMENTQTSDGNVQKLMQNGQIFIIRDGKMYNAQGQLVK